MLSYARATWRILCFYAHFVTRFHRIHPSLPSGDLLADLDALSALPVPAAPAKGAFAVEVGGGFRGEFNGAYDELKKELRGLLSASAGVRFETLLVRSYLVRALWAVAAWSGRLSAPLCLCVGLLQFVVAAPMSFVSCVMRFGTNGLDCVFHYAVNAIAVVLVTLAARVLVAASASNAASGALGLLHHPSLTVTLGGRFAAWFLIVDFAANLAVYLNVSERFGALRLLKHIVYGTYNTKMYFMVVIGCLGGLQIHLPTAALTGVLTVVMVRTGLKQRALRATGLPCFPDLFYCEHRINHCPIIYQHAHRQHHYLHDTTAFDAHIYGSGTCVCVCVCARVRARARICYVSPHLWCPALSQRACALVEGWPCVYPG